MASNRGPGRGPSRPGAKRPPQRKSATAATGSRPAAATGRRHTPPQLWRLGALIVLLGFLALFLTPTLRGYLDQRAAISRAEQQVAAEQDRIAGIEAELERWQDDAYVEQQARERLRFVKPGEVAFTVLDDTGEELSEPLSGMTPVTEDVHANRPWYGQVWESVITANEGVPEQETPPTTVPGDDTDGTDSDTDEEPATQSPGDDG